MKTLFFCLYVAFWIYIFYLYVKLLTVLNISPPIFIPLSGLITLLAVSYFHVD